MPLLKLLAVCYLLFGVIYAFYIWYRGGEPLKTFLLNIFAGPIVFVIAVIDAVRGKRIKYRG